MAANSTSFQKGKEPGPGRPPGLQNQINRTVKETVLAVFNEIQNDPKIKLSAFAKDFPRDFYAIAAKLIPTEISANVKSVHKLIIVRDTASSIPHSEFTPGTEISNGSAEEIQFDMLRPEMGENETE